ncbi:DUF1573 domain-containing protein [Marivirga sp.]|uniref:DUF1573 domain-containing protein n=1 Tax=Marivirga sp. TaxID=2018662 RepID=UPI002D7F0ABC|nr:DUF1573 domain-containing protein [Marivirga sp.]HET8860117.1 DUF1573 domain-containing protein [Marivirga sp.]
MKSIHYILIFYLIFTISCTENNSENNQDVQKENNLLTTIRFDNEIIDFGDVKQGDTLTARYSFKNSGANDLIIDYVNPECGCTSYTISQKRILASDSGYINLVIDTYDKIGNVNIYAIVKSNTKDKFNRLLVKANIK